MYLHLTCTDPSKLNGAAPPEALARVLDIDVLLEGPTGADVFDRMAAALLKLPRTGADAYVFTADTDARAAMLAEAIRGDYVLLAEDASISDNFRGVPIVAVTLN